MTEAAVDTRKEDPGYYQPWPYVGRPKIEWPGGARIAVWVAPNIEFYELDPPKNAFRTACSTGISDASSRPISAECPDVQRCLVKGAVKGVRIALENAVSVASVLLLTEATMTEIEEPHKETAGPPDMGM